MKSKCHLKKLHLTKTDVECDCDQSGFKMTSVKGGYYIFVCMAADTSLYLDTLPVGTQCNTVSSRAGFNTGQDLHPIT